MYRALHQRFSRCQISGLVAGLFVMLIPGLTLSTQDTDQGTPPYQVQVQLEYEIVIPQVIYFRVGTPGTTIDTVEFDLGAPSSLLPPVNDMIKSTPGIPLGNGAPVSATSMNIGGPRVIPVEIKANMGGVMIGTTVSNPMGLSDGFGHSIGFDQIATISGDNTDFPAPVLANSGIPSVAIAPTGFNGHVTERSTTWTYTYLNQTTPAAGVYTGTINYTAIAP